MLKTLTVSLLMLLCLSTTAWAQTTQGNNTQAASLKQLLATNQDAKASYHLNGKPSLVLNLNIKVEGKTPELKAKNFLKRWAPALGISPTSLVTLKTHKSALTTAVQFAQVYGKLPVLGHGLSVTMGKSGNVIAVNSQVAIWSFVAKGKVSQSDAKLTAARALHGKKLKEAPATARATRVVVAVAGKAVEAWMVRLPRTIKMYQPYVLISTTDGKVIGVRDAALQ